MRLFPSLLALLLGSALLLPGSTLAADGVQVDKEQIRALVDALKGRQLTRLQHDLLVQLGQEARASDDALAGDLIFTGWALVAADRPDLGYPLVKDGLAIQPLYATDALRSVLRASAAGQDGLVRGVVDLAEPINSKAAKRLERSARTPWSHDKASKRAKRWLKGLETGQWAMPFGDGQRVAWWVAPPDLAEPAPAVVMLPDGARFDGLPQECQSWKRLREASSLARHGFVVVLPALRGCDLSDGLYTGPEHALKDVGATIEHLKSQREVPRVTVMGWGDAGLTALQLAWLGLEADGFVALEPLDPWTLTHLPPDRIQEREVAGRLGELPDDVAIFYPDPGLTRALQEAGRPILWPDDAAFDAVLAATLRGGLSALDPPTE